MIYRKTIALKNGKECLLRCGTEKDAAGALKNFILTHDQTDNLLSYSDEIATTVEEEARFLKRRRESADEIMILAELDGEIVGSAGIERVGTCYKISRRAEFGISVDANYWGLGIGRALTRACVELAARAGYGQLELAVVATNARAIELYRSEGFVEYGRNPRGFYTRESEWREIVHMRLELND